MNANEIEVCQSCGGLYCPKGGMFAGRACVCGNRTPPPAEPDSGVQEKKCSLCDFPATSHCCPTNITTQFKPRDLWKPDAPSDHVEHVLRQALDPFACLADKFDVEPYNRKFPDDRCLKDDAVIGYHNFLTLGDCRRAKAALKQLLSSPRSTPPATVSASPDSAPWTVEDEDKYGQSRLSFGNTFVRLQTQLARKLRDCHNATLPALRSGSDSAAILEFQEVLCRIMEGGPEGWEPEWWKAMAKFIQYVPALRSKEVGGEDLGIPGAT